MLLSRVRCIVDQHTPIRDRVHCEGRHFTGTCKACGKPIWRKRPGEWHKQEPDPKHA